MNATQLDLFNQAPPEPPTSVPGCTLIYEPRGRAREYAALACNVYAGCDHRCSYCYAPSATFKDRETFAVSKTRPRFLSKLEKEATKYCAAGVRGQVLLSFTCDPYQHLDVKEQVTRHAIYTLHRYGLNVCVLTKGGSRALRDLDLFIPGDAFATTLTLLDDEASRRWEPHAALPGDRIATIQKFHDAGIPTWVSLEPVLDPKAALEIVRRTHPFVNGFKVGKLNYHPLAQSIDWRSFGHAAVDLLKSLGYREVGADHYLRTDEKCFYVKRDLQTYL